MSSSATIRNNRPSSFRGRQQSPIIPALRKRLENGEDNQQNLIHTQRSMSVGSRPGSKKVVFLLLLEGWDLKKKGLSVIKLF